MDYPATFIEIDDLSTDELKKLYRDLPPAESVRQAAMITKIRILIESRGETI